MFWLFIQQHDLLFEMMFSSQWQSSVMAFVGLTLVMSGIEEHWEFFFFNVWFRIILLTLISRTLLSEVIVLIDAKQGLNLWISL